MKVISKDFVYYKLFIIFIGSIGDIVGDRGDINGIYGNNEKGELTGDIGLLVLSVIIGINGAIFF